MSMFSSPLLVAIFSWKFQSFSPWTHVLQGQGDQGLNHILVNVTFITYLLGNIHCQIAFKLQLIVTTSIFCMILIVKAVKKQTFTLLDGICLWRSLCTLGRRPDH